MKEKFPPARSSDSGTLKSHIPLFQKDSKCMPDNSFDVTSKIDLNEVSNAIQQALKEIHTRFDLKD